MHVRPARRLLDNRRQRRELGDRLARHFEHDVVSASRQPQHGIVLRRWHHESVCADDVFVEARQLCGCIVECDLAPQLGPESGHEIDAAHGRPRLTKGRDRSYELRTGPPARHIELQVGVRRRSQREDPALRTPHPRNGVEVNPRWAPVATFVKNN